MIQNAEIISVNLLQILLSLANLVILYFLLERFFYVPVKNVMLTRESEIKKSYDHAESSIIAAEADKRAYESKLSEAEAQAASILLDSEAAAKVKAERLIEDAKVRASAILQQSREIAEAEMKNAEVQIKNQITEAGILLAGRLLEREISLDEHRVLINKFLNELDVFQEVG